MEPTELSIIPTFKELELEHSELLFKLVNRNRDYLKQWLPWVDRHNSLEDSTAFIKKVSDQSKKGLGPTFGIWLEDELIGIAGFHPIQKNNQSATIDCWLSRKYSNLGIATLAGNFLMIIAFEDLSIHRLEIRCVTSNTRGIKIAHALGFESEGISRESVWLNDRFVDQAIFSKLRSEYFED